MTTNQQIEFVYDDVDLENRAKKALAKGFFCEVNDSYREIRLEKIQGHAQAVMHLGALNTFYLWATFPLKHLFTSNLPFASRPPYCGSYFLLFLRFQNQIWQLHTGKLTGTPKKGFSLQ